MSQFETFARTGEVKPPYREQTLWTPIPDDQVIHRSRKTRAAFYDAANQVEGEVITLLQLMESMFELGFLDVSDMRWRTPTKTFRK